MRWAIKVNSKYLNSPFGMLSVQKRQTKKTEEGAKRSNNKNPSEEAIA